MSSSLTRVGRSQRRVHRVIITLGVAGLSLLLGVGLAAIGEAAGPALLVTGSLAVVFTAATLDHPLLAVSAVYLSLPIGLQTVPTAPLGLQVVEAAVLVSGTLVASHRLAAGSSPLPWAPEMWWPLLLVAAALVATPSALNLPNALKQDLTFVGGSVFGLTVLAASNSIADVRKLVAVLLLVGTGMSAAAVVDVGALRPSYGGEVVANRAEGVFFSPNELGAFTGILVMVAMGAYLGARRRPIRVIAACAAVVNLLALALSLSRGAWFGAVLALGVLLVIVPGAPRAVAALAATVLVVAALLVPMLPPTGAGQLGVIRQRIETFGAPSRNPQEGRPVIWREAVREILDDPMSGQGPASFPDAASRAGSSVRALEPLHAHSVPLTVAAEVGLPAMLVMLGFMAALGRAVLRVARRLPDAKDRALLAGIGCGLLTVAAQGVLDYNLRNPVIFLVVWSLIGMVLVAHRAVRHNEQAPVSVGGLG